MAYEFNHVHLKSPNPKATADWYVNAFEFTIISDTERPVGDRFIRCQTSDGVPINISSARTNEDLEDGNSNVHWGLEHFGITVLDMDAELKRLASLGAVIKEGPLDVPDGPTIAFIAAPDDTRIELLQLPNS